MPRSIKTYSGRLILYLSLMIISACSINMALPPSSTPENLKEWTDSPLAQAGKIFLIGNIDNTAANTLCQKLLIMDGDPKVNRISLYINSGSGDIGAAITIVNTIASLKKPVDTINQAFCLSVASAVYQGATGRRYAYSQTVFSIKAVTLSEYTYEDPAILTPYAIQRYTDLIKMKSSLPAEWFPLKASNYARQFSAEEAVKYRFVDEIIAISSRTINSGVGPSL